MSPSRTGAPVRHEPRAAQRCDGRGRFGAVDLSDGDHPDLSVVIPTYDRGSSVGRAVRSALRHAGASEVIVVDDASPRPPDLGGIGDPRLRLVSHETNRGVSAARNTGIRASRGTHILFLDDDDWLLPMAGALLRWWQRSAARRNGPDVIVVGGVAVVTPARRPRLRRPPSSHSGEIWGLDRHLLAGGRSFATKQAALVPKAVLERIGGWDETLRSRVTSEIFFRLTTVAPVVGHGWPIYALNRAPHPKLTADPELREHSVAYIRRKHADLLADPARGALFEENHRTMAARMAAHGG